LRDTSGDEPDGRDEAWRLADFQRTGVTGDDEINAILIRRHYGSRILAVSDSCFSGSVTRFVGDTARGRPRYIPGDGLDRAVAPVKTRVLARNPRALLSGCKDSEVSYDAVFNGRPNGAMTRVAIDT
jgi:hypothetical protein